MLLPVMQGGVCVGLLMCVCVCVCTYDCEDEEGCGDGGSAVEHDADVATCQFNVVRCGRNQNRRQQEAYGCSQLGNERNIVK